MKPSSLSQRTTMARDKKYTFGYILAEGASLLGKGVGLTFQGIGYSVETINQLLDKAIDETRHGRALKRESDLDITTDVKDEFLASLKAWSDKPENQHKNIADYQAEDPDGLFAKLKGESHD